MLLCLSQFTKWRAPIERSPSTCIERSESGFEPGNGRARFCVALVVAQLSCMAVAVAVVTVAAVATLSRHEAS